jgi:hypothetical protein
MNDIPRFIVSHSSDEEKEDLNSRYYDSDDNRAEEEDFRAFDLMVEETHKKHADDVIHGRSIDYLIYQSDMNMVNPKWNTLIQLAKKHHQTEALKKLREMKESDIQYRKLRRISLDSECEPETETETVAVAEAK